MQGILENKTRFLVELATEKDLEILEIQPAKWYSAVKNTLQTKIFTQYYFQPIGKTGKRITFSVLIT